MTERSGSYRRRLLTIVGIAVALSVAWPGLAARAQSAERSAVEPVLAAVLGVRAHIPDTARTASYLGTERAGSGVLIDGAGLVVTIGYLIMEAASVELVLDAQHTVPAQVVAYDHDSGLGLLRAVGSVGDIAPMRLGNSSGLVAGAHAVVASHGGANAARPAFVVDRREFAGYWEYLLEDAIFTSPPHPLYGGAALVGPEGELLGIGSLVVGDAFRGERIVPGNMFVPVDRLKAAIGDLLTHGHSVPPRPWLGMYTEELEGRLLVRHLAEEGPAEAAGLRRGDLILGVDSQPVTSMADFYRRAWAKRSAGDIVPIDVLRGMGVERIEVRSSDRYRWLRLDPAL